MAIDLQIYYFFKEEEEEEEEKKKRAKLIFNYLKTDKIKKTN